MMRKFLTESETASLFDYLATSKDHHGMILELMLLTGIRGHELWELKIADLDFLNETLTLWDAAKGSDGRMWGLPIWYVSRARGKVKESGLGPSDKLIDALGYKSKGGKVQTFKAILRRDWGIVRRRVFGVGFQLGLHSLRHTFAVTHHAACRDPRLTQKAMGHKSFMSTERYLNYSDMPKQIAITKGLYDNR